MPTHLHGENLHVPITATGPLDAGGGHYFVNTTEGAITLTVAADVTFFTVYDSHSNFALNNCTIDFGGAITRVMNVDGEVMTFFKDSLDAWRFMSIGIATGGAV